MTLDTSSSSSRRPPTTLVLVCCHAIFIGPPAEQLSPQPVTDLDPYDASQWLLQPFQATEAPTFIKHVQTGLDLLRADPSSILVFSGGRTRSGQGCAVSEAEGYARVAEWLLDTRESTAEQEGNEHEDRHGDIQALTGRIHLEEWATDSFQNVLFALLGWNVWTSGSNRSRTDFPRLPGKLVVVSHAFKRDRFMKLHLPAIRELMSETGKQMFDEMRVEYVGIDPPFSLEERKEVEEGERVRGYEPWIGDKYGIGDMLSGKRRARGWDGGTEYVDWWKKHVQKEGEFGEEVVREIGRMVRRK